MNIFVADPFGTEGTQPLGLTTPDMNDRDFSLELAELALTLGMRDDRAGFEATVRSATVSTGNDWLFTFPAARFPVPAEDVACVRVKSGPDATFAYIYRTDAASPFQIATSEDVGHELTDFARNFAAILLDLRDEISQLVS